MGWDVGQEREVACSDDSGSDGALILGGKSVAVCRMDLSAFVNALSKQTDVQMMYVLKGHILNFVVLKTTLILSVHLV